ncbi:MAG: DUF4124 domain-containing protein [Burkholderiaceae bacterium]
MTFLTLGLTASLSWGAIYTCTDASGRKLTSDRPIAECADRDQKELNSNATVKRTVKPVMTAQEQRAFDEKQKIQAEEQARTEEEKRKNRALLVRYPNRESHDKERAEASGQIDEVIKAATKRMGELGVQRKTIDAELEFYKKDPSKMPVSLKRQIEDNDSSVAVQKRFVADQESEKKRLNARFDEDLVKLKSLWQLATSAPGSVATEAKSVKK